MRQVLDLIWYALRLRRLSHGARVAAVTQGKAVIRIRVAAELNIYEE